MASPTKINYKIYQGSTFIEVLRWETYLKNYALISNIAKSAPCIIEAPNHQVPKGWRFKISGVQGMKEINTDEYLIASETTTDSITVNSLNTTLYSGYTSGGTIEYNMPKSLAGITARLQIREKLLSETPVLELTTETGGIIIDDSSKTITIKLSATQTAELVSKSYVYSLELVDGETVTQLIKGNLSVDFEITR